MIYRIVVLACFCLSGMAQDYATIAIPIEAQHYEKMPIFLGLIGNDAQLHEIGVLLKNALEFKGQLAVCVQELPERMTQQEVADLSKKNFIYAIFLENKPQAIEWRAYDISIAKNITSKGKKIAKRGSIMRGWAYAAADSLYEALMNEPGFFSTKIAYGKEVPLKNGTHYTHIYIADYDGSNAQPLIETPTINIAPRWNKDKNRPLIFYSENRNANMPMMAVDMRKKRVIASNFDGLNMLPTFSPDGKSVIYCATRGSGNCQLYHWSNKKLKKITNNNGNNFSPLFADDGKTIYFSSDFESPRPQIYAYDLDAQALQRITQDGYCVSPSYCAARKQLAYAKMVNGVMQLFRYDLVTQEHMQLTDDKAQKEECTWSACGTFLLCPVDNGKSSRIALFNIITKEYHYLTSAKDSCSFPAWSGIYNEYPVIG